MTQIELTDGVEPVLLRSYECGWEICWKRKRKNAETGEVELYWNPMKYYPVLSQALNSVAEFKIRASDANSLQELIKVVNTVREEITKTYSAALKEK